MIYYSKNTKNVLRRNGQNTYKENMSGMKKQTKKSKPTKLDLAVGEVLW